MELLTADDVLNKTFQTTKFREGYDVEEVDDFLDLVLGTLRALYEENDGLKAQVAAAQQSSGEVAEAPALAPEAPAEVVEAPVAEAPVVSEADFGQAQAALTEAQAKAAAAEEQLAQVQAAADQAAARAAELESQLTTAQAALAAQESSALEASPEPEAATGIIQLAQQLHDDHVRAGQEEGARIVSEAHSESSRIIREAEDTSTQTLNKLEHERSILENKIEDLKTFERDYRGRLQGYLEGLLGDLNGGNSGSSEASL